MEHFASKIAIAPPFDRTSASSVEPLRAVSTVEPLLHCSKVNAPCAFTLQPRLGGEKGHHVRRARDHLGPIPGGQRPGGWLGAVDGGPGTVSGKEEGMPP